MAAVVVLAGAVAVGRRLRPSGAGLGHPRTAIAVLPFQNLSAEGPRSYFAGGLHDELLTQLSKVASLTVISRTSVMEYAGHTKPLRHIARELGVGSIVEGSVQVVGGRLRVNVQLIDAATDAHLWAERFDRTLDDAFAVQSDVVYRDVATEGPLVAEDRARILAPTGEADAALEEIERLLARPSWLSVQTLRLDPRWDPIRNHPRFRALLARYAAR